MVLLCNILHFRSREISSVDEISNSDRLVFFASVVHKYACINAVRPISDGWLSNRNITDSIQAEKLLVISFRLDDAALFASTSQELVLCTADDFVTLKEAVAVSRSLPTQVIGTEGSHKMKSSKSNQP
jgi:hypothetical protein